LDESLHLAIGARGVGAREEMAQAEPMAGAGEAARAVARSVVRHHGGDTHPEATQRLHGPPQKAGGRAALLVRQHLAARQARGVVAAGVVRGLWCGRDDRSAKPSGLVPRPTHLRIVRSVTWKSVATRRAERPSSSTWRATSSRPRGVKRAFLCTFIRAPSWDVVMAWQPPTSLSWSGWTTPQTTS